MYPEFIDDAKKKANKHAQLSFDYANKVEQIHAHSTKKRSTAQKTKRTCLKQTYYVCPVCGNTFEGATPDKCPICAHAKEKFMKIN